MDPGTTAAELTGQVKRGHRELGPRPASMIVAGQWMTIGSRVPPYFKVG